MPNSRITEYTTIIDGFKLTMKPSEERQGGLVDLTISYICKGEVIWSSIVYRKVAQEKVEELTAMLRDHTHYNSTVDCVSRAITWCEMAKAAEEIIFAE